jgi:hypothetical protein
MAKGKKLKKIVPFTKTAPTEGIDKVPETAGLDDYDKMIAKLANSSDDIIDSALDKLDGHTFQPAPEPLQPETNEEVIPPPKDENHEHENSPVEPDYETINLRKELQSANAQVNNLNSMIESLRIENSELKNKAASSNSLEKNVSIFQDEISKLTTKNDDLILRNSELEFEISRLGAENLRLKQELERISNSRRLPPQTNTRESYTRVHPNAMSTVHGIPAGVRPQRPPRMSTNGYEYWT